MPLYSAHITLDLRWTYEVEADNEDEAYEELWNIIGYDGEDILDHDDEIDSEYFDISLREVTDAD